MENFTHTISIKESWLTDGSAVYRVEIFDHETTGAVRIEAVDYPAAYRMANDFAASMNNVRLALAKVEVKDQTYA